MSQLHFYVPDEEERQLRQQAEKAQLPLSRYLAGLVVQKAHNETSWPADYFQQVFGQWQGEPLERMPNDKFETRNALDKQSYLPGQQG